LDVDVLAEVVVPLLLQLFEEGLEGALVSHGLAGLREFVFGVL